MDIGVPYEKTNSNINYITEEIFFRENKFLNSNSTYKDYWKCEPCLRILSYLKVKFSFNVSVNSLCC